MRDRGAAQQDSSRTSITLIVPAARGGSADALGRLVADGLASIMEIPFRVVNIEGNSGVAGTTAIAAATRDGSVLGLAISSPMMGGKLLSRSAQYNPTEDFDWLGIFGTYPNAMVLSSRSNHTGIEEWLAAAREANPPMTCGIAGTGSAGHLAAAYLRFEQKARLTYVTLDAMDDGYARLRDGTLDILFDGVPSAIVNAPRTAQRIIAVTSMTRVPTLLEVPSFGELWQQSFEVWIGLVAPKGLPPAAFARVASAVGVLFARAAIRRCDARVRAQIPRVVRHRDEGIRRSGLPAQCETDSEAERGRIAPLARHSRRRARIGLRPAFRHSHTCGCECCCRTSPTSRQSKC